VSQNKTWPNANKIYYYIYCRKFRDLVFRVGWLLVQMYRSVVSVWASLFEFGALQLLNGTSQKYVDPKYGIIISSYYQSC
jgi:hypothetical protein